jgi:hypothetical protein
VFGGRCFGEHGSAVPQQAVPGVSMYGRVAQSDLPTPAPGSVRISLRPQMDGGRLREGRGKVFIRFHIRKRSQNIAKIKQQNATQS